MRPQSFRMNENRVRTAGRRSVSMLMMIVLLLKLIRCIAFCTSEDDTAVDTANEHTYLA